MKSSYIAAVVGALLVALAVGLLITPRPRPPHPYVYICTDSQREAGECL